MSPEPQDGDAHPFVAGRYRLLQLIGRGGMGLVWRAWDELLDREVAVKEVNSLAAHHDEGHRRNAYERARREALTAARIAHPNVVRIYDVADQDNRLWIVMELVPGRSLAQVVREDGPVSIQECVRIGLDLAAALHHVHAAGVLHRDVKPANVQLEPNGRIVLMDFGIAAMEDMGDTEDMDTTLTQTGVVVGTVGYMAPERVRGDSQQAASDLWALGATLHHAVTGRGPFARTTMFATLAAVLNEQAEVPETVGPLRPLLTELLDRNPDLRPTAAQVGVRLTALSEQHNPARALPPAQDTVPPAQDTARLRLRPLPRFPAVPDMHTHALREPRGTLPLAPSAGTVPPQHPADPGPPADQHAAPAVPVRDSQPSPEDSVPAAAEGPPLPSAPPVPSPVRSYIPRKPATAFARKPPRQQHPGS